MKVYYCVPRVQWRCAPTGFDPQSSEMHDGEAVCYTVDKVTFDLCPMWGHKVEGRLDDHRTAGSQENPPRILTEWKHLISNTRDGSRTDLAGSRENHVF